MKRLLPIIASVTLMLAACGDVGSSEDASIVFHSNENVSPAASAGDGAIGYKKITAEEAKSIIDDEETFVILDVRTEQEYSESRIDGALLIPHTSITSRAPVDLPDKDAIILVYCRSGARSAAASEALVKMGYTNVYDFGGIIDWPYETYSDLDAPEES